MMDKLELAAGFLGWVLLLSGCIPARAPDAGCVVACKHLTDLGCEEGGSECVPRCDEYQSGGLDMHTGCLAHVSSCEDTAECAMQ